MKDGFESTEMGQMDRNQVVNKSIMTSIKWNIVNSILGVVALSRTT